MGIRDNFKKLSDYSKIKSREKYVEKEVQKHLIDDTKYSKDYSSFTKGLLEKLTQALDEDKDGYLEITIKPLHNKRSFFVTFMNDSYMQTLYDIQETANKEFRFRLKSSGI